MPKGDIFTVKSGIKFGLGFYIGRAIYKFCDKVIGELIGEPLLKQTEKFVENIRESHPEFMKKEEDIKTARNSRVAETNERQEP